MSRRYGVHLCCFDAVDLGRGGTNSYEEFRARVLKAGRFSCFEATASMKVARMFTRLCAEPDLITIDQGLPWTGIRLREPGEKDPPPRRGTGEPIHLVMEPRR